MQALNLFLRRAILGRSNKSTVILEVIAKENSLNRPGQALSILTSMDSKMVLTFSRISP